MNPRSMEPPADELVVISRAQMNETLQRAKDSPRRRMIFKYHKTEADPLHRMLNAMEPGTYVRPHRHADPPKSEAWIVLQGALAFFTFEEDGRVREALRIAAGAERFGVDLAPGVYHAMVVLAPNTVVYEVKTGPYTPVDDKAFAPWAPAEGDPRAEGYMQSLLAELERRERG